WNQNSKEEVWYVRQQTSKHRGSTARYRSTSSAGPGHFQIGPAGRNRLEALPVVPSFGSPGSRRRSALGGRAVHHQSESAARRETDATPASGGSSLHSYFRRFLHRPRRSVRRR